MLLYIAGTWVFVFFNRTTRRLPPKKELLASEILELAEAKHHVMNCKEIIHDHMRYPAMDQYDRREQDFD